MSTDEANEEKPTHSYTDQKTAVLEILQGAHIGGATVEYGSLLLRKTRQGEQSVRVTQQGGVEVKPPSGPELYIVTDHEGTELLDAINVWAFQSVSDLRAHLDDLDRRHVGGEILDADAEGNVVSIEDARAD